MRDRIINIRDRRLLLLAFLFHLVISPGYSQVTENSWKELVSGEGNCKVLMPGAAKDLTAPSPFMKGEKEFQYELQTDYLLFKFGFSKVPVSPKADDPTVMKAFWDKYIANMEKSEGVKVISQRDIEVGGFFGREVVMSQTQGELILVNRYIARDYRFYTLITATYPENEKSPAITKLRRKYLDSFAFLK